MKSYLIIYSCIVKALAQGADFVQKGSGFDQKHKTEVKYKNNDELNTKLVVTNKDWEVEAEYAPKAFNNERV